MSPKKTLIPTGILLITIAFILLSACAPADANKIPIAVFRSPT